MRDAKFVFVLVLVANTWADNCKIEWIETGKEVPISQYALQLSVIGANGDSLTYFPDTSYDIIIKSKHLKNQTITQFYFTLWNKNESRSHGILDIRERKLTRFHNGLYCKNRVIDGPVSLAKPQVKIGWQSPPVGSGCIELKAYIKETELRYHLANKTVCQDPRVELDDPGEILKNCCACYDGKYELAFEGLWSRYTHPNHFPLREWLAVFPTVIGASHSHDIEFWHPYTLASNGLKKFARTGRTVDLELELKKMHRDISTLIKIRGANFQNKTRRSFATLRVNRYKHVVSLVARIDPSPDWFVGVSSLELCRPDCSWIPKKTFNLYAWDAGVQNGILYEDLEGETSPQDIIQSLNMTWPPASPTGKKSPFYDATNNTHDVRPLARIHFNLLHDSESNSCRSAKVPVVDECVSEWAAWGPCSVECGTGVKKRLRFYLENYDASNCDQVLEDTGNCQGTRAECPKEVTEKDCELSEWSQWSPCKRICGQETTERSRNFLNNEDECKKAFPEKHGKTKEKKDCGNPPCPDDKFKCEPEMYTSWTEWSPCSAEGHQYRHRTFKKTKSGDGDGGYRACLNEVQTCEVTSDVRNALVGIGEGHFRPSDLTYSNKHGIPDLCFLPVDPGECPDGRHDNSIRIYYDKSEARCSHFTYSGCGGNLNRFNYERDCIELCARKVDCELSDWSEWTKCKNCIDFSYRSKEPARLPVNGGKECPKFNTRESRACADVLDKCRNKQTS